VLPDYGIFFTTEQPATVVIEDRSNSIRCLADIVLQNRSMPNMKSSATVTWRRETATQATKAVREEENRIFAGVMAHSVRRLLPARAQ
jgi:hypothetical protein